MVNPREGEITKLLEAIRDGRPNAADELMSLVYAELRFMAERQYQQRPAAGTLQPTALVHEAYLRLFGRDSPPSFENRSHFFYAAARAMRDLMVEKARARARLKRGGHLARMELDPETLAADAQSDEVLSIHEALGALPAVDARAAKVVELRFFGGLEHEEIAQVLGVAESTVRRDWTFARAWLRQRLGDGDLPGPDSAAS